MSVVICKFCKKEFYWKSKQKQYCSDECKLKAKESIVKEQYQNNCVICKKDFFSAKDGTMYCSGACNQKAHEIRNKKDYSHNCEFCKKDFISQIIDTRFCSLSCAGKYKNEKGTNKIIKCKECKKEFSQKHLRHFYCSSKCKAKNNERDSIKQTTNCSTCNKELKRNKYTIEHQNNFFCNRKCESDFREKEANDTRSCENCKKDFHCKKGDKLRFCSIDCQSEWQKNSEWNKGKNHPNFNHLISDEMRTKKCECCGKEMAGTPKSFETNKYCSRQCMIKSNPKSMTFPHRETVRILNELSIEFETEKKFERYSIDCAIQNSNLFIEVMGVFWHCDNRYYIEPIDKIQVRAIKKDFEKNKKIISSGNILLYIWEKDITENYEICKKLIQEFFKKNGKLKNYHSMNYEIKNGKLKLRSEILIPFFERI